MTTRAGSRKSRAKKPPAVSVTTAESTEVRGLAKNVSSLLWGSAAGRCEFEGCNKSLVRSPLTQDTLVLGEAAHIRAFSPLGPRGQPGTRRIGINDLENLMLLCTVCHKTVDKGSGPDKYTAARLRAMKVAHESRVYAACEATAPRVSQVLLYTTHVGTRHPMPTESDAGAALVGQRRYPTRAPINLGTRDGAYACIDSEFWSKEAHRLATQFDRQVGQRIEAGEIQHLSVFALAPQPLLIQLGTLVGDITPADTYQRHREPSTWDWPATESDLEFAVSRPASVDGQPALVLSVSATISADRIERILGNGACIWRLQIAQPNNDVVKSPNALSNFRAKVRPLLDVIKAAHGHTTPLHVFPALPASLAVELGRIRMPKADSPWILYDEQATAGGFVPALTIGGVSNK